MYLQTPKKGELNMGHIGAPGGDFSSFSGIIEGDETICRKCMSHEETIIAVRGFADKLSEEEANTGNYTCSRCNKVLKWGEKYVWRCRRRFIKNT